jgi:hypothetical protein
MGDRIGNDADLCAFLRTLDPHGRDTLHRVLIRDQADRDAISSRLMRYRDERGGDWADIIDLLTMHPEVRRRVVRMLGEIEATNCPIPVREPSRWLPALVRGRSGQPSSQTIPGRMLGEHWDVAQDVRPATQVRSRFLETFGHLLG